MGGRTTISTVCSEDSASAGVKKGEELGTKLAGDYGRCLFRFSERWRSLHAESPVQKNANACTPNTTTLIRHHTRQNKRWPTLEQRTLQKYSPSRTTQRAFYRSVLLPPYGRAPRASLQVFDSSAAAEASPRPEPRALHACLQRYDDNKGARPARQRGHRQLYVRQGKHVCIEKGNLKPFFAAVSCFKLQ